MWKRHVEREKVEETTSSSNKKYSTERLVDEQRKLSCVQLGSIFDDKHALPSIDLNRPLALARQNGHLGGQLQSFAVQQSK